MFVETKFFHKAGEGSGGGGGGSDPHNKGSFLTPEALRTAYPTAQPGDFAIVESTDTVWVWDSDTSNWKDGDTKGQVTSVNGQTGAVTVDTLPSQTGNSGKFLTTDGTNASWGNALENIATGFYAITTGGGTAATEVGAINIGYNSTARGIGTVSIGPAAVSSNTSGGQICIGYQTRADGAACIAIGSNAQINASGASNAIAIGNSARAGAQHAIQLGCGTNNRANTFCVGLTQYSDGNYRLLNSDGTIPKERLVNFVTTPSTAPVLAVADWSSKTQTITVTGVTATNTVFVAPAPASAEDYAEAGILCTAQAADSLTFTCTTVPSNAITLSVVILG